MALANLSQCWNLHLIGRRIEWAIGCKIGQWENLRQVEDNNNLGWLAIWQVKLWVFWGHCSLSLGNFGLTVFWTDGHWDENNEQISLQWTADCDTHDYKNLHNTKAIFGFIAIMARMYMNVYHQVADYLIFNFINVVFRRLPDKILYLYFLLIDRILTHLLINPCYSITNERCLKEGIK